MKKLSVILLALFMCVAFAGCFSSNSSSLSDVLQGQDIPEYESDEVNDDSEITLQEDETIDTPSKQETILYMLENGGYDHLPYGASLRFVSVAGAEGYELRYGSYDAEGSNIDYFDNYSNITDNVNNVCFDFDEDIDVVEIRAYKTLSTGETVYSEWETLMDCFVDKAEDYIDVDDWGIQTDSIYTVYPYDDIMNN